MKKNFIRNMAACAAVALAAGGAWADTQKVGGYTWTYRVVNGGAEIYNPTTSGDPTVKVAVSPKPKGDFEIPSSLGGYPVTRIGCMALICCDKMTTLTIPDSVTSIGLMALSGCYSLADVVLPSSSVIISFNAFSGCKKLAQITLQSETEINANTYPDDYDFAFINQITLTAEVTVLANSAAKGCNSWQGSIQSFVVAEDNPWYKAVDGMLLTKDGKTLLEGINGDVTIPDGVEEINMGLIDVGSPFHRRENLTRVTIPASVVDIGLESFNGCIKLRRVYFLGSTAPNACGAYLWTPNDLVTYVLEGSTGWMEKGSTALPDKWPVVSLLDYTAADLGDDGRRAIAFKLPSQSANAIVGGKVEFDVGLVGYKATGLPAGLSYNATTGYVTGTPKAAGEYEATFTKKDESEATVIFTIRAEEVSVGCEGLSSGTFVAGVAGNADGIPLEIDTETGVKSVTVTKLPTGMKYDAKTGRITGAPTKAGDYSVTLTVTTAGGAKQTVTIPVAVAALPDAVIGTFNGFVKSGYGENVGTFQLAATDAGKLTAKVTTASGSYSFSGTCWNSVEEGVYSVSLTTKKGDALTLELDSSAGWNGTQLTGAFAAAGGAWREVEARKNAFGKTWYFNAEGNVDDGWELSYAANAKAAALTVTLNADGTTKVAGKLGTLSASASGYADVTEIAGGVIHADFAPIVSVKDGKATVKRALSLRANLWFDRSNDHLEGAGTAKIVKE